MNFSAEILNKYSELNNLYDTYSDVIRVVSEKEMVKYNIVKPNLSDIVSKAEATGNTVEQIIDDMLTSFNDEVSTLISTGHTKLFNETIQQVSERINYSPEQLMNMSPKDIVLILKQEIRKLTGEWANSYNMDELIASLNES